MVHLKRWAQRGESNLATSVFKLYTQPGESFRPLQSSFIPGEAIAMSSGPVASTGYATTTSQDPVVVSLLVILTVVCALIWSYYWCSPICRSLCRRWKCCCCRLEPDTDSESGAFASRSSCAATSTTSRSAPGVHNIHRPVMGTPTLILLPHGRMLVVDGTIFAQLRAENTGELKKKCSDSENRFCIEENVNNSMIEKFKTDSQ